MSGNEFLPWVITETEERGWSYSELARRMGVSSAGVTRVINGARGVTWEFCVGIAKAFGEPLESVLRRAGFLPNLPLAVVEEREAIRLLRAMPPQMRAMILTQMRSLVQTLPDPTAREALTSSQESTTLTKEERLLEAIRRAWQLLEEGKFPEGISHVLRELDAPTRAHTMRELERLKAECDEKDEGDEGEQETRDATT